MTQGSYTMADEESKVHKNLNILKVTHLDGSADS